MGVIDSTTFRDGKTPICNACGVWLCWDISNEEYAQAAPFWDSWVCEDCNGGRPMRLSGWKHARKNMQDLS